MSTSQTGSFAQPYGSISGGTTTSVNTITGDYTLADTDLAGGGVINADFTAGQSITIPAGLTGTEPVTVVSTDVGPVTFVPAVGVTVYSEGGSLVQSVTGTAVTVLPIGVNTYVIYGDGLDAAASTGSFASGVLPSFYVEVDPITIEHVAAGSAGTSPSHYAAFGTQITDKRYWEVQAQSGTNPVNSYAGVIKDPTIAEAENTTFTEDLLGSFGYRIGTAFVRTNGTLSSGNLSSTAITDILMFQCDGATGDVWYGVNGVWNDDPLAAANDTITGFTELYAGVNLNDVGDIVKIFTSASNQTYAAPAGSTPLDD